ncbi:MAG: HEAT repeat domain-containing protein [Actinobacteria bacterium]|nr:MAG: HEAT repeat domain-containing protein [Actinomycetota bacterium]
METSSDTQQPSPIQARVHLARNIVRALNSTNNAITLYPPDSPMPREAAAGFIAALERFLMFEPYLQLSVAADGLRLEGEDVCGESSSLKRLAFQLHTRQVGQIRFMPGLDSEECVTLLRVLGVEAEVLRAKGGLSAALAAKGVRHVAVVDLAQEAAAEAGARPEQVGSRRVEGVAGLSAEQLLDSDASGVCRWLQETAEDVSARGLPARETATEMARVIASGAEMASSHEGAAGARGMDNLAAAIMSLGESSRRELLSVLLRSEDLGAGALQSVLARIGDAELAAALVQEADPTGADPKRLLDGEALDEARRERVAEMARELAQSGRHQQPAGGQEPPAGESKADERQIRPADLSPNPRRAMAPSLPRYSRRGDDVPFSPSQLAEDSRSFSSEERDELLQAPNLANADESLRSATTLLYLLNRTSEESAAAETVESMVSLADRALSSAQVGVLVRILCGLRLKHQHLDPTSPLAHHVDQALNSLSSPDVAAGVIGLLDGQNGSRLEPAVEYFLAAQPIAQEAAIEAFGGSAPPELKRQIQTIFARLGPRAIGAAERHVSDPRWPVALHSVAVLGRIGEPRVVPALRRALSHSESRVIQQAIKSLGSIGGREAEEALVWAVESGEAQARMLAIRALGTQQSAIAVGPLRRLLESGDAFGRSLEEKLSAIEALGAIGTTEAIEALSQARQKRFVFSPSKTKLMREAAMRHLERLTTE